MDTHQKEERPFKCEMCYMTFSQSDSLTRHKTIHFVKQFRCDTCGKSFSQKNILTMHKRIHTGEKPYSCGICEKAFIKSNDLVRHKRIHTGEKPYSCITCKKDFRTNGELTLHKRIHTGEKPHSCKLCYKSYFSSSELSRHNKSAGHLKLLESNKKAVTLSASTNFVDCVEANIKLEIKEEVETIDEDPLSIKMEAENAKETIKYEIEEDIQDKYSDDDRINNIDILNIKLKYDDDVN